MDLSILQAELTADPEGLGYAGMTDRQAADAMNVVNRPRNRTSMTGSEVARNINSTEFAALPDVNKDRIVGICGIDDLDPFGWAARAFIDAFGAGSTTLNTLAAARVETVSRGVELGLGFVGEADVQDARAL